MAADPICMYSPCEKFEENDRIAFLTYGPVPNAAREASEIMLSWALAYNYEIDGWEGALTREYKCWTCQRTLVCQHCETSRPPKKKLTVNLAVPSLEDAEREGFDWIFRIEYTGSRFSPVPVGGKKFVTSK